MRQWMLCWWELSDPVLQLPIISTFWTQISGNHLTEYSKFWALYCLWYCCYGFFTFFPKFQKWMQDKILTFWEISKAEIKELEARLREKDRIAEGVEDEHQTEVKVCFLFKGPLILTASNDPRIIFILLILQQDEWQGAQSRETCPLWNSDVTYDNLHDYHAGDVDSSYVKVQCCRWSWTEFLHCATNICADQLTFLVALILFAFERPASEVLCSFYINHYHTLQSFLTSCNLVLMSPVRCAGLQAEDQASTIWASE